jgi:hypothetical protein
MMSALIAAARQDRAANDTHHTHLQQTCQTFVCAVENSADPKNSCFTKEPRMVTTLGSALRELRNGVGADGQPNAALRWLQTQPQPSA